MNYRKLKTRLVQATAITALASAMAISGAIAQEDTVSEVAVNSVEDEARQETVVVTGSLIPQSANLIGTSPVSTIGAEEFDVRGVVRAEDLINTLPQAFGAQGASLANGASGTPIRKSMMPLGVMSS